MLREIVEIDEALCDGCGDCVPSCAEGAIRIVDGKARLLGDELCDGLGACLGECPQGAIRVVQRDAVAFDEVAVARHLGHVPRVSLHVVPPPAATPPRRPFAVVQPAEEPSGGGCPGARSRDIRPVRPAPGPGAGTGPAAARGSGAGTDEAPASQLSHWPVQLGLVNPRAPWLAGADLLLAADCVPFAYAGFHQDLLAGRRVVVGCPKLDDAQAHVEKLAAILRESRPASLTVALMEVPCCGGIARAAREAARLSGVTVPITEVVIGVEGNRLS